MTKSKILKLAIEIAVKKGFDINIPECNQWKAHDGIIDYELMFQDSAREYYAIIFNHSFSKSFWGEKYFYTDGRNENIVDKKPKHFSYPNDYRLVWEVRLQNMVLKPDPLKYIELFL